MTEPEVPTLAHKPSAANEYNIRMGENLPNHSSALIGRAKFIRQNMPDMPTFRTKQAAYRYAAWLVALADDFLPNESETCEPCTFDAVLEAVIEEL